jgi:hypothetical protein
MRSRFRLPALSLTLLSIIVLTISLVNTRNVAIASDNDSIFSYLALSSSVSHSVKHYNRNQNAGGTYLNTWSVTNSQQVYSYYQDARGSWTFQRQQTTGLPSGGKYYERYIWDSKSNPSASTWLYLDYASLNGDMYPSLSSSTNCKQSPFTISGCDYVSPAGEQWLPNITATPSQGTSSSPAIQQWDSSTIGPNEGDLYYQGGVLRATSNSYFYGQIWKRNNWDTNTFKGYPASVNTADAYGWADPTISSDNTITLSPQYVYIVRQYSGCDSSGNVPWHACEIFEDHVYAKSSSNAQQAEIMVVIGFTPKHDNWYQTVGDIYAVTHVMVAIN